MSSSSFSSDEVWTAEDEMVFRPLIRKYVRIHQRTLRDKSRKKRYGARRRVSD